MRSRRTRRVARIRGRSTQLQAEIRFNDALVDLLGDLVDAVSQLEDQGESKSEVQPLARYRLSEAAEFLGTSPSTLKRRARVGKFVITYDGRTPFVMGAEILRYARDGAKRRSPARGQRRR